MFRTIPSGAGCWPKGYAVAFTFLRSFSGTGRAKCSEAASECSPFLYAKTKFGFRSGVRQKQATASSTFWGAYKAMPKCSGLGKVPAFGASRSLLTPWPSTASPARAEHPQKTLTSQRIPIKAPRVPELATLTLSDGDLQHGTCLRRRSTVKDQTKGLATCVMLPEFTLNV